jgi:hypothetical protein
MKLISFSRGENVLKRDVDTAEISTEGILFIKNSYSMVRNHWVYYHLTFQVL